MRRIVLVLVVALQIACSGLFVVEEEEPVVEDEVRVVDPLAPPVDAGVAGVEDDPGESDDSDEGADVAPTPGVATSPAADASEAAGPEGVSPAKTEAPAPASPAVPASAPSPAAPSAAPAASTAPAPPIAPAPKPAPVSDKNGAKNDSLAKPPPPASVELAPPQITGKLSARSAEEVFRRNKDELKSCYANELAKTPDLRGQAVYQLTVDATGTVSRVQLQWSRLGNANVEMCVKGRLKKLTFESPKEEVTIVQAITFAPAPGP